MIRIIFAFVVVFLIFFFGLKLFTQLSGKEKWVLTKLFAYSLICAIITTVFLVSIVVLF
jgi:hypothetical protein